MSTPTTSPELRPATAQLTQLLDDELQFSPSFLQHYSTHLAMELVALHQMEAPPELLQRVFDEHAATECEPRDDVDDLERMQREVAERGIAATVASRVRGLVRAPNTALYHPMIRLAYALDVGHEGQVAAALLDWERRFDVLPFPPVVSGRRSLTDVADELAATSWEPTFDLHPLARHPSMAAALSGLATDDLTLDDVSTFALHAHVAADAFVTLHLVTGARAVRAVSAWLDDDTAHELTVHMARSMVVADAAVGAPPLPSPATLGAIRDGRLPGRADIIERAVADLDPHVVKLANVALVEEARTGDRLYRYLAARVVGLA